jgi:hypothetical protein
MVRARGLILKAWTHHQDNLHMLQALQVRCSQKRVDARASEPWESGCRHNSNDALADGRAQREGGDGLGQ